MRHAVTQLTEINGLETARTLAEDLSSFGIYDSNSIQHCLSVHCTVLWLARYLTICMYILYDYSYIYSAARLALWILSLLPYFITFISFDIIASYGGDISAAPPICLRVPLISFDDAIMIFVRYRRGRRSTSFSSLSALSPSLHIYPHVKIYSTLAIQNCVIFVPTSFFLFSFIVSH